MFIRKKYGFKKVKLLTSSTSNNTCEACLGDFFTPADLTMQVS